MSARQYRRGSELIRREIDATLTPVARDSEPLNWADERARLSAELNRARAALARSRATLTVERDTSAELRAEIEGLKAERAAWARAFLLAQKRWRWVSAIVRTFVTPAQVAEFREERESR